MFPTLYKAQNLSLIKAKNLSCKNINLFDQNYSSIVIRFDNLMHINFLTFNKLLLILKNTIKKTLNY